MVTTNECQTRGKQVRGKVIVLAILGTLAAFAIYYPFSPGAEQRRNMALARQYLPTVNAIIHADRRFAHVTAGEFTGEGGSLLMSGAVRSQDDLAALEREVEAKPSRAKVVWKVAVYPPPAFDEVVK